MTSTSQVGPERISNVPSRNGAPSGPFPDHADPSTRLTPGQRPESTHLLRESDPLRTRREPGFAADALSTASRSRSWSMVPVPSSIIWLQNGGHRLPKATQSLDAFDMGLAVLFIMVRCPDNFF